MNTYIEFLEFREEYLWAEYRKVTGDEEQLCLLEEVADLRVLLAAERAKETAK